MGAFGLLSYAINGGGNVFAVGGKDFAMAMISKPETSTAAPPSQKIARDYAAVPDERDYQPMETTRVLGVEQLTSLE
jgi:hypothetical protein